MRIRAPWAALLALVVGVLIAGCDNQGEPEWGVLSVKATPLIETGDFWHYSIKHYLHNGESTCKDVEGLVEQIRGKYPKERMHRIIWSSIVSMSTSCHMYKEEAQRLLRQARNVELISAEAWEDSTSGAQYHRDLACSLMTAYYILTHIEGINCEDIWVPPVHERAPD